MDTKILENPTTITNDVNGMDSEGENSPITVEEQLEKRYGIPKEGKSWSSRLRRSCSCSGTIFRE